VVAYLAFCAYVWLRWYRRLRAVQDGEATEGDGAHVQRPSNHADRDSQTDQA